MCDANVQKPLSKKKMLLRAVIFAVVAALVFLYLNAVFTIPNSDPNRRIFNAFYAEEKDTIDAVYLGTSATNRYFIGPLAYEETGLAEFDLAAMGMPLIFVQNLMKEVEKTQDPALYIIELRGVLKGREDVTDAHIRRITDSMRISSNKYDTIKLALEYAGGTDSSGAGNSDPDSADTGSADAANDTSGGTSADSGTTNDASSKASEADGSSGSSGGDGSNAGDAGDESGKTMFLSGGSVDDGPLDYYVPILKYHNRITSGNLTPKDIFLWRSKNKVKGYVIGPKTLTSKAQKKPVYSDERAALEPEMEQTLNELLDYCDSLGDDKQVLFVLSPYSMKSGEAEKFNTAADIVQARGYDILNCNQPEIAEEIGLDWKKDFYNSKHVNYMGAEKYTKYLTAYISEHYDMPDRRGDEKYESWSKAYEHYKTFVSQGIQPENSEQLK